MTCCIYCSAVDDDIATASLFSATYSSGSIDITAINNYIAAGFVYTCTYATCRTAVAACSERASAVDGEGRALGNEDAGIPSVKSSHSVIAFKDYSGVAFAGDARPFAIEIIFAFDGYTIERDGGIGGDGDFVFAAEFSCNDAAVGYLYVVANFSEVNDVVVFFSEAVYVYYVIITVFKTCVRCCISVVVSTVVCGDGDLVCSGDGGVDFVCGALRCDCKTVDCYVFGVDVFIVAFERELSNSLLVLEDGGLIFYGDFFLFGNLFYCNSGNGAVEFFLIWSLMCRPVPSNQFR